MHNYGNGHPEYNAAVRKELEAFFKANEIDPTKMTAGEAKQFVSDIRTSSVPAIRQFNMRVLSRL
jgi:hypothetical protein